ncbi:MAG: hypothetical protein H0T15_07320 [Thermoleophilaceae bacterium]|nr:hypothetical protein [Thermoleophilaceae bacterium]
MTRPLLEEWAEVASFDPPGVGDEPDDGRPDDAGIIARALAETGRRGWDRYFVVADSFAVPAAVAIAEQRPDAAEGLALGHPSLRYPAGNRELYEAMGRLLETDFGSFIRAGVMQLTGGSYDEDLLERAIARVPREVAQRVWIEHRNVELDLGAKLAALGKPLLLAEHVGCIAIEAGVFADATAAFPDAATVSLPNAPATDPGFAEALRGFCT